MRRELIAQQLELALRESLASPRLRLLDIAGQRPAEDEKREPWIPIKYGPAAPDNWFGVVPAAVRSSARPGRVPKASPWSSR
jgi:hypothetical protein